MGELDGRVALVTAGSRGVGRAIVDAFLDEGAAVVLNGRSEAKGREALEELGAGEAARFVAADVMRAGECERLLDETIAAYGRVDILVNNAGGAEDNAPVAETSDHCVQVALDWCLWATFWCTRRALNDMIPRGWGRVINVSSLEGKCGKLITSSYVAAKHAVNGLTKSCAAEVGPLGITVNALCPGAMDTDIMREVGAQIAAAREIEYDEFLDVFRAESATREMTDTADVGAEDVARVAVLLASPTITSITGCLFPVDGGTMPY